MLVMASFKFIENQVVKISCFIPITVSRRVDDFILISTTPPRPIRFAHRARHPSLQEGKF
jgi:hypothetical protein